MPATAYYAIALSMSQAVSLAVAFLAWRRRSVAGSVYLALMMLAVAVWSAAAAIEAASTAQNAEILWLQISYIGVVSNLHLDSSSSYNIGCGNEQFASSDVE